MRRDEGKEQGQQRPRCDPWRRGDCAQLNSGCILVPARVSGGYSCLSGKMVGASLYHPGRRAAGARSLYAARPQTGQPGDRGDHLVSNSVASRLLDVAVDELRDFRHE